ncbi:bifunctional glycosyltransferase/CDP-glycerol:glycerophosphate glycerophosphotransferase [Vibrio crassostreae]|uniref:bifunctional glycosyltransferase/CDP-glycerol:glycerophosphate glycerophosphotransferase n=1 Tax=Vibrio crassostreae TaxID=246167 RepID=UPI001B30E040|nr:CDP-glycerol glycerophosphotransferase family protein [Vibrio crassostreae]
MIGNLSKKQKTISIVSAVYGVEKYIDDFIESVAKQSIGFKKEIELILVDDCSNDGSYERCIAWQKKYPKNITVIKQEINQGQAAARNKGVEVATGKWLNFADPDDTLHPNFFRHLLRAALTHPTCKMISGQIRSHYEETGKTTNDHPLGWRYKKDVWLTDVMDEPNAIHFHAAITLFDRELVIKHKLKFDKRVRPSFEDALFVNQYTLRTKETQRCFVEKARYHYRKRVAKNSTLDTAWSKQEKYNDLMKYGHTVLLDEAKEEYGFIPTFILNTIIYELSWYFRKMNGVPLNETCLDEKSAKAFHDKLETLLKRVPANLIIKYSASKLTQDIRFQMVTLANGDWSAPTIAAVVNENKGDREVRVSYMVKLDEVENIQTVDGSCSISDRKEVKLELFGKTICHRRYEWVSFPEGESHVNLEFKGRPMKISVHGHHLPESQFCIEDFFVDISKQGSQKTMDCHQEKIVKQAKAAGKWNQKDCWLFMDRDYQADDNGEHMYRYVQKNHPNINAFFVLNRESKDWCRLEAEGFQMIPYGSEIHKSALLNAKHVLSSHADEYVISPLDRKVFGEHLSYKFHFLQHGVSQGDLSRWLNNKRISSLMTASDKEHVAFVKGHGYSFTEKNVHLTGFPRHDRLIEMNETSTGEKIIAIMPTWRKNHELKFKAGSTKAINESEIRNTSYYKNWNALLNSKNLKKLYDDEGYKIVFFPHANMAKQIQLFDVPDFIEIGFNNGTMSIQKVFATSSLMITDYSSVSFEMAVLRKPVIYYQFDIDTYYDGSNISQRGYFNHSEEGFGPAFRSFKEIEQWLTQVRGDELGFDIELYKKRAEDFLPSKSVDGSASERVFNIVSNM